MSAFPTSEAQLVALFMQSVTYGIHVVIFAICMWKLVEKLKGKRGSVNWPWAFVAIALFVNGTVDVSFNLYHNLLAFTLRDGTVEGFGELASWISVIRMYRAWIICDRQWATILPTIVLWCTTVATMIAYLYRMTVTEEATVTGEEKRMAPMLVVIYSTTLTNNFICTGMIVRRIWQVSKRSAQFFVSGNSLSRTNRIFVESALLYTTTMVVLFITILVGNNALYGVSDVSLELAGIAFDLIIIRISRGTATELTEEFVGQKGKKILLLAVHLVKKW
ncbi:hypothetical protein POSPLADRAFT_1043180 [Postia placenta MAD-698-R-SB12]|uniref:Uncharacterized protein n=1 Tax=Postia placenta MAD-698-R-SB12 TaxID=670580 RepID=A0A1X6NHC4_9APHY|nr:hypothetical protein POSPLADRAFT_1043180 [Postia placenta MAD-698-R-SB12]OSX68021.1 hypothetical protein POSPLADRAFT_1043180 [Postia placenta MAD-698-R-SB12]